MTKRILAIANYRVSSNKQLLSGSLDRQEKAVLKAAKELGVEIVRYWSGSVSSKKWSNIDRKDLEEMLDTCRKNPYIKYAIFDELDRFMRSMLELAHFIVEFKKLGVKVVFASQPNLKTDTAADTLILMLEAYKAEGSNEERQNKSIKGQTNALNDGRYPFCPKPGYKKGSLKGVPEIHEIRGPILRATLLDIYTRRKTPTQALIDLNDSDFTIGHSPYKMDKFRKIVKDPFYAAVVEINKQVKVRNPNGIHEPLITLEQHHELVKIMDGKEKTQKGPNKDGNPKYPLNNMVVCDTCTEQKNGGRIVGFDTNNGKNRERIYEKYRCRSCNTLQNRSELHPKIEKLFEDTPMIQTGLNDLTKALDIVWKRREGEDVQEAHRTRSKIKALNENIGQQVEAATNPDNSSIKQEIIELISKRKAEVKKLEEKLESLVNGAEADKEEFLHFAFHFIENMGSKFLEISKENRLRCKQIVFPGGIYVDNNKKVYTPEISLLYRLATKEKDAEASVDSLLVRVKGL